MRKPSEIKAWLTEEQFAAWLKNADEVYVYKKRLAIRLTALLGLPAHKVAEILQVSIQSVWSWIKAYNELGPKGLESSGPGGYRWSLMHNDDETIIMQRLVARIEQGELLTTKKIQEALGDILGKKVSISYTYKLLHRNGWRKLEGNWKPE